MENGKWKTDCNADGLFCVINPKLPSEMSVTIGLAYL